MSVPDNVWNFVHIVENMLGASWENYLEAACIESQLDKKRVFKHLVLIRESNRRELTGFVPRVLIQLITVVTGFDRYLSDRLLYSSKKLRGTYFTRAAEDNLIFKYLIKVLLLFGSEGWFRKSQWKPRTPRYSWHRTKLDPVKCKRKFT